MSSEASLIRRLIDFKAKLINITFAIYINSTLKLRILIMTPVLRA